MILAFQVLSNLCACLCLQICYKGAPLDQRSEASIELHWTQGRPKTLVCLC